MPYASLPPRFVLGENPAGTLDVERALPIDDVVHPACWTHRTKTGDCRGPYVMAVKPDTLLLCGNL